MAEALLGPRNKLASTRDTWRWGTKGSLAVEIRGPNRGLWFSHEGATGSDLFGLIQFARSCRFPEALVWARQFTGFTEDESQGKGGYRASPRPAAPPDDDEAAEAAADRASRIAFAQRIPAVSVPVSGTPGEIYLKQHRGIAEPAAGWPGAIKWHAGYRALVAVATMEDGTVTAVQRIHLGADAAKISAAEMTERRLQAVKLTNGVTEGAAVRFPGPADRPLVLAEGPETGLAVYSSTGFETWVALGSIAKLQPPIGRTVVVASDDNPAAFDAKRGQAAKALQKALRTWRKAGIKVVVATPWATRRRDGSDFADVILHHGQDAVRERIQAALSPARTATKRLSVDQAREAVGAAVRGFFGRIDAISARWAEWDEKAAGAMEMPSSGERAATGRANLPNRSSASHCSFDDDADQWDRVLNTPVQERPTDVFTHGVRVDVGVGKSHLAREEIAKLLVAMRKRGDKRAIVLAVPMHALSDEQAERFRELPIVQAAGLRVEVWRGRAAVDPHHPDATSRDPARVRSATMCQRLDDVRDAQTVGLSAQNSCCRRRIMKPIGTKSTVTCPVFSACSYQAQTGRTADLWIMASDLLWHQKPSAMGEVACVVVDEGCWRKGLVGAEGRHVTIAVDALDQDVRITAKNDFGTNLAEERLRDLRRQLFEVFRSLPEGPVRKQYIVGTALTAESAAEAHRLEWMRKVDPLHPGMSREERRTALAAAEGNKTIARFAMLWDGLRALLAPGGPDASGWLSIATEQGKSGAVRVVHLKGRREIAEGWKAPTLLLDALLPVDLVRPFWPDIQLVADVRAEMPFQHVRQVVDRAFSLSMLGQLDEEAAAADPEEAQRRVNRLHDLRATLIKQARHYAPGRVLVVPQKRVREALSDLGQLPTNLVLAHHNNVAGRDEWRDVAALIVVGRTQPSPAAVRRVAEALTGQAAEGLADWYQRADAVREMADGSTMQAEADRHPDPLAEMIRWQTCEGELVQIIGRARGVNRTAADPVSVLVLTDVPLPIPLAGTLDAVELTPGPADHMMAAGGVIIENPTDASAAYPFLWANRNTAKSALQRAKLGAFPYEESNIGECTQLRRIDYKAAGQGRQAAIAGFDPVLCPDPEGFLTERLGKLAWCRVEAPPPEPDPPVRPAPEPSPRLPDEPGRGDEAPHDRDVDPHGEAPRPTRAPPMVYDVPWLHADAPAYLAEDGAVVVPSCPYCGEVHRHRGFGHRLAHCADQRGRGYVLKRAGSPLPPCPSAGADPSFQPMRSPS